MLPGFFLSPIIRRLRSNVNLISLVMICAGLLFIGLFKAHFWLIAGCTLVGLGYGIIQPIVYDKAAAAAPLAIGDIGPFGRDVGKLSGDRSLSVHYRPVAKHSAHAGRTLPFILSAGLAFVAVLLTWRYRNSYAFGLDKSYYRQ